MKSKLFNHAAEERNKLRVQIAESLKGHSEIIFAYIYGSFAEGSSFHDIDLGIFVSGISKNNSIIYMLDLAQEVSRYLRTPVDVRLLNFVPVTFSFHVIQGDLVVDQDAEIRSSFVERVIRKYLDLKPRIRMAIKEAFAS